MLRRMPQERPNMKHVIPQHEWQFGILNISTSRKMATNSPRGSDPKRPTNWYMVKVEARLRGRQISKLEGERWGRGEQCDSFPSAAVEQQHDAGFIWGENLRWKYLWLWHACINWLEKTSILFDCWRIVLFLKCAKKKKNKVKTSFTWDLPT